MICVCLSVCVQESGSLREIMLIGHITSTKILFFIFCMTMAVIHKKESAFVKAPKYKNVLGRDAGCGC